MNTNFKALSIAAAVAASLSLAACSTTSGVTSGNGMGMNHSSPSTMASMMPSASADHNQADIMFAQMMIPHHSQAVEMSDIILAKQGIPAEVTALATKIKGAQAPEIQQMSGWLQSWNQPSMMSDQSGHGMAGMVDDDGLAKLKAAEGSEAARLFLQQMIGHHEGAIDMAQQEIGAGKYPDAVQLSRNIVSSQQAEIIQMKELLTTV